ncbi:hypothetical protein [Haloferula sp.]|uniref:hypothetical protein n=1 Tax=Haloferula sp. TaxID=2497595 RepID=UPI00329CE493
MKNTDPINRIPWVVVVALSLLAAFYGGRMISGDSNSASGEGGASAISSSREQLRQGSDSRIWKASTATERTLELIDQLDRCETREDFQQMVREIELHADKSEKQRFLALLFGLWLDEDPVSALSEVRRVELLRRDGGRVSTAFMQWAVKDPSAAADLLKLVLDGRQSDPASAPPFLDGVDPPEFLLSAVAGIAVSDPDLAASTLVGAGDSPVRRLSVEVLLQDWYPANQEEVRKWASSIDEPTSRRLALEVTGTKAGQGDDPSESLAWAMELEDGNDRRAVLLALTGQWSQRHASDASAWVAGLPDGELKFAVMPDVVRQLTVIDPGAAADWLNQYEAAPEMDLSVAAYAKAVQYSNPDAALGSAEAITDPEFRAKVLTAIRKNQRP